MVIGYESVMNLGDESGRLSASSCRSEYVSSSATLISCVFMSTISLSIRSAQAFQGGNSIKTGELSRYQVPKNRV